MTQDNKEAVSPELEDLSMEFLENSPVKLKEINNGLLHKTYIASTPTNKIVLQRLSNIFRSNIDNLISNYLSIHAHISQNSNILSVPSPLVSRNGNLVIYDSNKNPYRAFEYAELNTSSDGSRLAPRFFGEYAAVLNSDNNMKLFKTLSNFHELNFYASLLEARLEQHNPSPETEYLIKKYEKFKPLVDEGSQLLQTLPERITHNDAKIDNFLPSYTKNYVIDLDTTFSGAFLLDYGDIVRTSVLDIKENDVRRLTKNNSCDLDIAKYESAAREYLRGIKNIISPDEIYSLSFGAIFVVLELFLRFFADYLSGNTYFNVSYEKENLDKAFTQAHILELLLEKRLICEKVIGNLISSPKTN